MAVKLNVLTDAAVKGAGPGDYGDGGGLYLTITPSLSKSWVYRYKWRGRTNRIGLGPVHAVSLKQARVKAAECRAMLADGVNPRDDRSSSPPTFAGAFERFIETQGPAFSNAKHKAQWRSTLEAYARRLMPLPVNQITAEHVQEVLAPIWYTKPETARRVRQRIAKVLGFAAAHKWRPRDNPADWKDNLDHILKDNRAREKKHHRAMAYDEVPAFMRELSERDALSARAMEFLILTGARTGEVISARWDQINLTDGTWTRPADMMKARVPHTVFLGPKAVELLRRLKPVTGHRGYLFAGPKGGKPSNMALLQLLTRMNRRADATSHGFRSALTDWAHEETRHDRHIIEMALAHTIGSKVEAAYRRGTLEKKRRALAEDWEAFLTTGVTPVRADDAQEAA